MRISPKDDGGLLGAAELAWDAVNGVPLRAAVYAQGQADPVLELEATDDLLRRDRRCRPPRRVPAGAEVVDVDPPAGHGARARQARGRPGVDAVQRELDFHLAAPDKLAGLPAQGGPAGELRRRGRRAELYGEGLGAIVVLQQQGRRRPAGPAREQIQLPKVNIDGATGTELATALGTVVTLRARRRRVHGAGSVPPVAAENAARGLR